MRGSVTSISLLCYQSHPKKPTKCPQYSEGIGAEPGNGNINTKLKIMLWLPEIGFCTPYTSEQEHGHLLVYFWSEGSIFQYLKIK